MTKTNRSWKHLNLQNLSNITKKAFTFSSGGSILRVNGQVIQGHVTSLLLVKMAAYVWTEEEEAQQFLIKVIKNENIRIEILILLHSIKCHINFQTNMH